jgi:hypothetical protein
VVVPSPLDRSAYSTEMREYQQPRMATSNNSNQPSEIRQLRRFKLRHGRRGGVVVLEIRDSKDPVTKSHRTRLQRIIRLK